MPNSGATEAAIAAATAGGAGTSTSPPAFFARDYELRIEVGNLKDDVRGLHNDLSEIRSNMATKSDFASIANSMNAGFQRFESTDRERREREKVNWPAIIGVVISAILVTCTIVSGIGYLTLSPVREQLSDFRASSTADRAALHSEIADLRSGVVPRPEHEREWKVRDESIKELRAQVMANQKDLVPRDVYASTISSIQRQIDEQRVAFGSTYSLRDALADMQRRLDRVEMLREQRHNRPAFSIPGS